MDKIQKAIAKLYFALGEQNGKKATNAENPAFCAEYLAYLAIRNTGESLGNRYFAMGAAAADRTAHKPPRGKSPAKLRTGKLKPPKGKKAKTEEIEDDSELDWEDGVYK